MSDMGSTCYPIHPATAKVPTAPLSGATRHLLHGRERTLWPSELVRHGASVLISPVDYAAQSRAVSANAFHVD